MSNYVNQNTIHIKINGTVGVYFLQIQSENGEKTTLRVVKN